MSNFLHRVFVQRIFVVGLCAMMLLLVSCETKMMPKKRPSPVACNGPDDCAVHANSTPTPLPTPTPQPQPEKPDPVVSTIADAEHAYEAGLADYRPDIWTRPSKILIMPWTS